MCWTSEMPDAESPCVFCLERQPVCLIWIPYIMGTLLHAIMHCKTSTLWSPSSGLKLDFSVFLYQKTERKYVAAKKILPSSNFQETEQRGYIPPGIFRYAISVPWHRCGWGALTLQLSCPGPGPWVHCAYSETRKGVGKKRSHFFKVSVFLNIWIVSPSFLSPSNTHYCKENFGCCGRKKKCLSQYGPGKKDVSSVSTPTAIRQAWEILIAGKQNTNYPCNCFYQVALSFS